MQSLDKILLPVDFSARSAGAAHYAKALAGHFHSELILVHALTPLYSDMGGMEVTGSMLVDVYRNRAAQAALELDGFATAHLAGKKVRCAVLNGDPSAQVVDLAHQE